MKNKKLNLNKIEKYCISNKITHWSDVPQCCTCRKVGKCSKKENPEIDAGAGAIKFSSNMKIRNFRFGWEWKQQSRYVYYSCADWEKKK